MSDPNQSFATLFKNEDKPVKIEVKEDRYVIAHLHKNSYIKKKDIIKWLHIEVDDNLTHLDILYPLFKNILNYAKNNKFTSEYSREIMFGEFCSWAYINSSLIKYPS